MPKAERKAEQKLQSESKPPKSERKRSKSEQQPPAKSLSSRGLGWTAARWLNGSQVENAVAAALCEASEGSEVQLKKMRDLGCRGDELKAREAVRAQLLNGDIVEKIIDQIMPALLDLSLKKAEASSASELHSKFVSEGSAFTLSYGGLEEFFGGLEKKIGAPQASTHCGEWSGLEGSLASEHLERDDSNVKFRAENYGTETSSVIEHTFCAKPGARQHWPTEAKLSGKLASRRRKPLDLEELAARVETKNKLLAAAKEPTLLRVESIGARLYTGPMFVKYNAVLRGLGSPIAFLRKGFEDLCLGNVYTTTLHVINSSIVKLSKLTHVTKVYRGVSGGVLPEAFWVPNDFGVCGGVESAFMSATTDPSVALTYASNPGKAGVVFEIAQGMVDRGADMAWVSQYPHEAEITFAPLTGLEVQQTSVDGSLLKIGVRLSVNLAAPTIEQVLAKRKKVVTDMCVHMSESLERELKGKAWDVLTDLLSSDGDDGVSGDGVDVIELARSQLQASLARATDAPAEHFNEDVLLGKAIQVAVEARRSVDFPAGIFVLQQCDFGSSSHLAATRNSTSDNGRASPSTVAPGLTRDATTTALPALVSKRRNDPAVASGDWPAMVKWLQASDVDKLDFGRTALGDAGVGALALLLHHIPGTLTSVERLNLEKTGVGRVGVGRLCDAIENGGAFPELKEFVLSRNSLSNSGVEEIARALSKGAMANLRELSLANVECQCRGLIALADALESDAKPLQHLKELDLSDNAIADRGMMRLADAMSTGALPVLIILTLGSNDIGDGGASALANALLERKDLAIGGDGKNLEELALDNNWIGDGGFNDLAKAIGKGCLPSLKMFALDDNLIADEGMTTFANVLLSNPSGALPMLQSLDLDGSDITHKGFDLLAEALKAHALPCLEALEIDDDELDNVEFITICKERSITVR